MTLPNALVIGPQKAGTTWIHHYLESRGDICLPKGVKETMFFDRRFDKGTEWYARHFQPLPQHKRTIEVAPTYFHHIEVPRHVREILGDIPLLCTLRDPAERSFSLYLHMRRYGMTACEDFRQAVERYPELIETSRYATHLERWIDLFGSDKILALFQDDLAGRPTEYAASLCRHLGISFLEPDEALKGRINAAALPQSPTLAAMGHQISRGLRFVRMYSVVNLAKKIGLKPIFFGRPGGNLPYINKDERSWFIDKMLPEIDRLEAILQKDLSHWKQV